MLVIKFNSMFMLDKEKGRLIIEKLNEFCGYIIVYWFGRLVESKMYVCKVFWVMVCFGVFIMFFC